MLLNFPGHRTALPGLYDPNARGVGAEKPSQGQGDWTAGIRTGLNTHMQMASVEILSASSLH